MLQTIQQEIQKALNIFHPSFDAGFTPMGILIININTKNKVDDMETMKRVQQYLKDDTAQNHGVEQLHDETPFGLEYFGTRLSITLKK